MILHICPAADWAELTDGEPYRAASLDEVGFVHCSDPGTVHLPAARFYPGRTDLVLLRIDPARLDVPVRWEPAVPAEPGTPWFPHVYGPVPRRAVVSIHPFPPEPGGGFRLPPELASPG